MIRGGAVFPPLFCVTFLFSGNYILSGLHIPTVSWNRNLFIHRNRCLMFVYLFIRDCYLKPRKYKKLIFFLPSHLIDSFAFMNSKYSSFSLIILLALSHHYPSSSVANGKINTLLIPEASCMLLKTSIPGNCDTLCLVFWKMSKRCFSLLCLSFRRRAF